ncbi:hypothetical protein H072_2004 [Dactylellina haptotyla CBS 200.50]|uniref:non-specific serine/threonine protein kinase n=1 Tax=Dactylellina haptotyla (strain CBS 200.50) TaxID=1284197 RepID=S8ASN7_DACHA|nr:hypothetical protein H072_2004 [Dactylellina haptotyla CBS 200.50]
MAPRYKDTDVLSSSDEGDEEEEEEETDFDDGVSDDAHSGRVSSSVQLSESQTPGHAEPSQSSIFASTSKNGNQFDLRNEEHLRMLLQATSTEHQIREHLRRPEFKHRSAEDKQRILDNSLKKMAEFGALDPRVLEFGGKPYESHRNAVRVYMGSLIDAVSGDLGETKALEAATSNLHLNSPIALQIPTPRVGLEPIREQGSGITAIFGPRWEEIECLGKGGFGSVWACKNHLDDEVYAIKKIIITEQFLKVAQIADETDREKAFAELHHEVKILARLDHPNIVRYYSSWMERMSSEDFEKIKHRVCPEGMSEYTEDSGLSVESSDQEDFSAMGDDEEVENDGDNSNKGNQHRENSVPEEYSTNSLQLSDARRPQTSLSGIDIFGNSSSLSTNSNSSSELEIVPRSASQLLLPAITGNPNVHILSIQMARYTLSLNDFIRTPTDNGAPPRGIGVEYEFMPKIAVELMLRIVDGVEYMHHYHLVHRDLKPANIFLKLETGRIGGQQGSVIISGCKCSHRGNACPKNGGCLPGELCSVTPKIGDFGLTADIKRILELASEKRKKSLQDPVAAGTTFYMPPAWCEMTPKGRKSEKVPAHIKDKSLHLGDAYALGIILFELLHQFNTNIQRHIEIGKLRENPRPEDPFPADFCQKYKLSLGPDNFTKLKSLIYRLTCERELRMGVSELKHELEILLDQL